MLTHITSIAGVGVVTFGLPEQCPMCKSGISPKIVHIVRNCDLFSDNYPGYSIAMACPTCHQLFVAQYEDKGVDGHYHIKQIGPKTPELKSFDSALSEVSPTFIEIYNQALAAESYGLNHIAGMGYRKSLEFLIKDYAKILQPSEANNIEAMMLSPCIKQYIDHPKIKATATASVWLGNDETHYIRKFDDKDVQDLKRFITSCVYWILADYDASSATELITK